MSLAITFAVCAVALAIVGVYGVIAHSVSHRARDIGIRIALGADGARIALMIAREFAGVVVAGLITGAIAAILLTRVLSSMLFGVSDGRGDVRRRADRSCRRKRRCSLLASAARDARRSTHGDSHRVSEYKYCIDAGTDDCSFSRGQP